MLFRQLFDKTSSTYTYLIAEKSGQEGIIIDPVLSKLDLYLKLLTELDIKLAYSIDTHTHADHITASGQLSSQLNSQIIVGYESLTTQPARRVKDGDEISIEGLTLHAMHTPGHTSDSYCYLMKNCVFTGDTLFIRGTGRTDFQGGGSEQQYNSLFNKLLKLPDDTLIYPGHDYNGMTVSTIKEEKQFNPRLQVETAQAYADIMDNLNLERPAMIGVAVPANLQCGLANLIRSPS
jgi:sulfur dioxygenase